jgi:hypothetical protein
VLVVSDQRLLVCVTPEREMLSWQDESRDRLETIGSVPRTGISAAAVHRYRLRRRLRITFGDGSWGAFVTAPGEPLDAARRLAAALSR